MTRENIIRMAREAGISQSHAEGMFDFLERFFHMAQASEREACAEICQQQSELQLDERVMRGIDVCKDAIRARGQTKS